MLDMGTRPAQSPRNRPHPVSAAKATHTPRGRRAGLAGLCVVLATCLVMAPHAVADPVIESIAWEKRDVGYDTFVDITFTFTHSENAHCWLALWGHDEVTREHFPMQEFVEGDLSDQTFTPGTHTLTWIASVNAGGRSSDDFQIFLRLSDEGRVAAGHYVVIDVSGGPEASSYPIEYRHAIDATRDEYKTDKIVMRELPNGRYSGVYHVTQQQYEHVTGLTPSYFGGNPMRHVERVTWNDITASGNYDTGFIALLREKTGIDGFDLPTSANWEYTCRAGATMDYNDYTLNNGLGGAYGGSSPDPVLDNLGWYGSNSSSRTHDVGGKQPNAWGLYDTHGNAWEWTVTVRDSGVTRVIRGGSGDYSANYCRAGDVTRTFPFVDGSFNGFRLALPAFQSKGAGVPVGGTSPTESGGARSAKCVDRQHRPRRQECAPRICSGLYDGTAFEYHC